MINHEITRLKIYEKYIKVDTLEVAKLFSVTNDIEKAARREKMNDFFFCIERGKFQLDFESEFIKGLKSVRLHSLLQLKNW